MSLIPHSIQNPNTWLSNEKDSYLCFKKTIEMIFQIVQRKISDKTHFGRREKVKVERYLAQLTA